jgi:hypothetical protein
VTSWAGRSLRRSSLDAEVAGCAGQTVLLRHGRRVLRVGSCGALNVS